MSTTYVCAHGHPDCHNGIRDDGRNSWDCSCRPDYLRKLRRSALARKVPRKLMIVEFERAPIINMPKEVQKTLRGYLRNLPAYIEGPNDGMSDDDYRRALELQGRGLWFVGPRGTGKSSCAALIAKTAQIDLGYRVGWWSVARLLGRLREGFDARSSASHEELLDELLSLDLLVLDDLAAHKTTEHSLQELFIVINQRTEEDGLPVIATSDVMPEQLGDHIDDRNVSRLLHACGQPIVLGGEDHRRLNAYDPLREFGGASDDDEIRAYRPQPSVRADDDDPGVSF